MIEFPHPEGKYLPRIRVDYIGPIEQDSISGSHMRFEFFGDVHKFFVPVDVNGGSYPIAYSHGTIQLGSERRDWISTGHTHILDAETKRWIPVNAPRDKDFVNLTKVFIKKRKMNILWQLTTRDADYVSYDQTINPVFRNPDGPNFILGPDNWVLWYLCIRVNETKTQRIRIPDHFVTPEGRWASDTYAYLANEAKSTGNISCLR